MTIIQVMHSHSLGGVERHVVLLSRELSRRGHKVIVACPSRSWIWDALEGSTVTTWHIAMDGLGDSTSVGRLSKLVHNGKADVLHAHLPRGTFYAAKAGNRSGVPVIATAHSGDSTKHYEAADRIICVAEAVRRCLSRNDIPEEKLRVIYNGILPPSPPPSPAIRAAVRYSWGMGDDNKVVGMLARLIPEKGADLLVTLAERWANLHPEVRFVIAGPGAASDEALIRSEIRGRGLGGIVQVVGRVANPYEALASFDVLSVPSRRESFPAVIPEAFALGVPVVATQVGGIPEIVEDGSTGFLFPVDDLDGFSTALERALYGTGTTEIALRASALVRERFSVERMTDEIEQQYIEVSAARRSREV